MAVSKKASFFLCSKIGEPPHFQGLLVEKGIKGNFRYFHNTAWKCEKRRCYPRSTTAYASLPDDGSLAERLNAFFELAASAFKYR